MINLKEILTLTDPFVAAASGLVILNEKFYIVSDDELGLFSYPLDGDHKGQMVPLFEGFLPTETKERKKVKPDFESIVYLPGQKALLCLPSGSTEKRIKGALIDAQGVVQEIKFTKVMQYLSSLLPELNIEGAIVFNKTIKLFQRGNGELGQNAIIEMDLNDFLNDKVTGPTFTRVELGEFNGLPLSFTDATFHLDQCWFTAVAEDSKSTYFDGPFRGAILGKMDLKGNILETYELGIKSKPEGIAILSDTFFLVTDDDDRTKPSKVYSALLP